MKEQSLKVSGTTHADFMKIKREMAVEMNRNVSQDYALQIMIIMYRKTHPESKRNSKGLNRHDG